VCIRVRRGSGVRKDTKRVEREKMPYVEIPFTLIKIVNKFDIP